MGSAAPGTDRAGRPACGTAAAAAAARPRARPCARPRRARPAASLLRPTPTRSAPSGLNAPPPSVPAATAAGRNPATSQITVLSRLSMASRSPVRLEHGVVGVGKRLQELLLRRPEHARGPVSGGEDEEPCVGARGVGERLRFGDTRRPGSGSRGRRRGRSPSGSIQPATPEVAVSLRPILPSAKRQTRLGQPGWPPATRYRPSALKAARASTPGRTRAAARQPTPVPCPPEPHRAVCGGGDQKAAVGAEARRVRRASADERRHDSSREQLHADTALTRRRDEPAVRAEVHPVRRAPGCHKRDRQRQRDEPCPQRFLSLWCRPRLAPRSAPARG